MRLRLVSSTYDYREGEITLIRSVAPSFSVRARLTDGVTEEMGIKDPGSYYLILSGVEALRLDDHTRVQVDFLPIGKINFDADDLNKVEYRLDVSNLGILLVLVLNMTNEPVSHTRVSLSRLGGKGGFETIEVYETTTDIHGHCAFYGLTPGTYGVMAEGQIGAVRHLPITHGREEIVLLRTQ